MSNDKCPVCGNKNDRYDEGYRDGLKLAKAENELDKLRKEEAEAKKKILEENILGLVDEPLLQNIKTEYIKMIQVKLLIE